MTEDIRVASAIKTLIEQSCQNVSLAVNKEMTLVYWKVGKRINDEVFGNKGAAHGQQDIAILSRLSET